MDFQLSEQQRLIVETISRFADSELRDEARERTDTPMTTDRLRELLRFISRFGFLGARIPENDGGSGLDFVTTMMMYEELYRVFPSLAGAAFVNEVVAFAIYRDGTAAQKDRYLPGLISGDLIACQAATEAHGGSDVRALRMRVRKQDGHYLLQGRKVWITNGVHADVCVALVRTGEGDDSPISRVLVDREPDGFSARELPTIGLRGLSTAELLFDDIEIPTDNLLGKEGGGLTDTLVDFEAARCYGAVCSLGVARAALEDAVAYAGEREVFGKTISRHQLVQVQIADMATELDCARLLILRAAEQIDRGIRCDYETSMAKVFATEAAVRITSSAIQVHGAVGLCAEYPVERYFRDARMGTVPDGTSDIQRMIIARHLLGVSAF